MLQHFAPIILASGSAIRQQMLRAVGLHFSVEPSGLDEDAVKATVQHLPVGEQAQALARAKALSVSIARPDAYTVGADQMCELDGRIFDKPGTYPNAAAQLTTLAGHTHRQHSGIVLARGEEILWEHHYSASLTMRPLTPQEIDAYVKEDAPLSSCGAYKFESLGRHLFAHVEGDHDVIKGLPLLPLLVQLHLHGVVALVP
jgi:septum formation protein